MKKILLYLIGTSALLCRSQTYNFRNYSGAEGLPQAYVYCISQSPNGFLNLSTGDGFLVFDGNKFRDYSMKNGLKENFVTTHYTDSRNTTWLGHFQKGVSYRKNSGFYSLHNSKLEGTRINQFVEDADNTIWMATAGGVYRLDTLYNLWEFDELKNTVNSLCFDTDNELLCGTNEGLFCYDISSGEPKLRSTVKELENYTIKYILPASNSRTVFWVAVEGEGVYGIHRSGKTYTVFTKITTDLKSKNRKISSIYCDRSGDLWIALFGEGLRKISFSGNFENFKYSITSIEKRNGLINEYIQYIFQDDEGNMWFGTFGEGLIEKPVEKFAFYDSRNGLAIPDIKAILTDKTGALWLGNDKGLNYFETGDNFESIQYNTKNGFVNDQVNSLLRDRTGLIWIGTNNSGVFTFDPFLKRFENFSQKHKLKSLNVTSIVQDKDEIIIGTGEGIYFYDPKFRSVRLTTTVEGLLHNSIKSLFVDSKQRLWICSHGAPPYYVMEKEVKAFKNIPELHSYNLNSMMEDKNGNIWLASEGDGVFRYDGKEWMNFKNENGLLSNYCYSIVSDKNNSVWVAHKNGLSQLKPGHKDFQYYSVTESLLFTENNLNAAARDEAGNLWFGTASGIVHFNTENEKKYYYEPKVSINEVLLNRESYAVDNTIVKDYGNYSLQINYIGVSLSAPDKVVYKYRLLGLDTAWHFTTNRSIEYPKLNDGKYTFQLMAGSNNGFWSAIPAQVVLEIGMPVWKKSWFYLILLFEMIAIPYSIIWWRTRSLKKAKVVLEMKIAEKTFLLKQEKEVVEKIKVELETKNKDITDSINYAKRIQEALLPAKKAILEKLPETFIYYKPRDIVSGDFYWFTETSDCYIIAAIDCTGHGVPGAFMSLIGSTLLNEIINNNGVSIPAEILSKLNSKIIKILHQQYSDVSSYDGMDMGICCITKDKTLCRFAGAQRPLYIVRNNELTELKGNTTSIGGHDTETNKTFTEHEVNILPGDMLYLFSDGYSDQFGANNRKKFTTKRLKDMFIEISQLDVKEQRLQIENSFREWKGEERQLDDVLVIGVRV